MIRNVAKRGEEERGSCVNTVMKKEKRKKEKRKRKKRNDYKQCAGSSRSLLPTDIVN